MVKMSKNDSLRSFYPSQFVETGYQFDCPAIYEAPKTGNNNEIVQKQ